MDRIILGGLPIPISSNHMYTNALIRGRNRRIKTAEARLCENEFKQWALVNSKALRQAQNHIKSWIAAKRMVKVERFFGFKYESLWTLKGQPKKMDVTNRLKMFDDLLSGALDCDDKWFWAGGEEKLVIGETDAPERAFVVLSPRVPMSYEEVRDSLLSGGPNI